MQGALTFIAFAIGACLVGIEFQEGFDSLLILGRLGGVGTARHNRSKWQDLL